jgi:dipeptidyl aminopeptidase/acylaminoacyl peptidase
MQNDIRNTELYAEAETVFTAIRQPGTGQINDAADVSVSADGAQVVFAGTLTERLEGTPPTRICVTSCTTGDTRVLTFGPHTDRLPKFSPVGGQIAFLSDRAQEGNFQLYLIERDSSAARAAPRVKGWVEYLHWSPDGKRILLGVAGHGADVSGGQGAVSSKQSAQTLPSWVPTVETGDESYRWRSVWIYELATERIAQISMPGLNVWEAIWCGNDALATVASPGPGEGLWYKAHLHVIEIETGHSRTLFEPQDQIGWPAASASGKTLAVIEAVCSDRWFVAGKLRLIDVESGAVRSVEAEVDFTHTEWRSDARLLLGGHRGLATVTGVCDASTGTFNELWSSREITSGGFYPCVAGVGESGDCVLAARGFARAPEIGAVRQGRYHTIKSFDVGYSKQAEVLQAAECVSWKAPDGLDIEGWLLRPKAKGPLPLVMSVHGGPVWQWRPTALGAAFLMLLRRGYAIFLPNPRGSSGWGQSFIRRVVGDMGGADAHDLLSGLDHLVNAGVVDPKRIGVTGGSYGGFMTAWLITQDTRFAAAIPVAPVTNQVTEHLISNIPHFVQLFLGDSYANPNGKYFERSPVMFAHKVTTPTLNICGALDRCTPPEEAVQFHNALLENGVRSVLVTYPEEGHGVRKFPAAIDYAARVVDWFERYMST